MIISAQKPFDEIKKTIQPYQRLAIFGCGGCAAVCQTGGTKQVEELALRLVDKEVVFTFQIDEPCDKRILTRELSRVSDRLEQIEAVLILACGIGVQMIADSIAKPCFTGLDTLFAGAVIHSNNCIETCTACGQCRLNTTAAICPRTLCPKGIANGPCSEKIGEHCSVNSDEICVWLKIAERMDAQHIGESDSAFSLQIWNVFSAPRRIPDKACVNEQLEKQKWKK
jgi:ferredoxin